MIKNILTVLLFVFLILFVGFFTSSETAYLSLSKLKLRTMVEQKKRNAKLVAKLKGDMDKLLTTVLIGTNLLNSLVSALATSLVIKLFGGGGVGLSTLATAFFITTFGQIIPKTIAGLYPSTLARLYAVPLYFIKLILFPVVWLFERLSHLVVKIAEKGIKNQGPAVTEEELKTLIDVGEKEGTIEKNESRMMNKIIQFNNLTVTDIMKHRSFVSMLSEDMNHQQVVEEFRRTGFSTLPVYKNSVENVTGVINYQDVLYTTNAEDMGEGYAGRAKKEVPLVPGTFSVLEILQKFRSMELKFAVVLNEQGETAGIVTMEDVIKVVFGRMTDENSYNDLPPEDKIKLVSSDTFIVPGDLKLDDVNEILQLKLESDDMNTIGGWLLEKFGTLPSVGEVIVDNRVIYTVEDVYQRRIVLVRVKVKN